MDDATYDDAGIILNRWPPWVQQGDGRWTRSWSLTFSAPISDEQLSTARLNSESLAVTVSRSEAAKGLALVATAGEDAWSDQVYYFAFYDLFRALERAFGPIETIQGEPRDLWRPFR